MDLETAAEFLEDWLEENVDTAALPAGTIAGARRLAERCLGDALDEGVEEAALLEVAGGDLVARILAARDASEGPGRSGA